MSQWPASYLRGLYPELVDAPCAGCGEALPDDAECYATHEHIWHYWCWPKVLQNDASPAEAGPTHGA